MLFVAVEYVLRFPFDVYRWFIIESEYGFMNQSFLAWWGDDLLRLFVLCVIGIVPVMLFYWTVSRYKRWWLLFSVAAIPMVVLLVVIAPIWISPLFNDFVPIEDTELKSKLLALASEAGIENPDVFQVNASRQSSKINAYVTGLLGTKRIVLYDTMIDNFTHDEILFVMGHEMGHYVKNDVWWGVMAAVLFIAFTLWLTDRLVHRVIRKFKRYYRFDRLSDIASLPLVLLLASVIMFLFQPLTNSYSRYIEHHADAFAMEISGVSGVTAAKSFEKLSAFNLSDPDPHPVIEFWFYTHPAASKRIEFVTSYNLGR